MKNIVLLLVLIFGFSGCIAKNENNEVVGLKGIITGATYKPEIIVDIYEVVVKGVVTYMSKEQIESLKLDKVDAAIRYVYSITAEGKQVINEDAVLKLDSNISL